MAEVRELMDETPPCGPRGREPQQLTPHYAVAYSSSSRNDGRVALRTGSRSPGTRNSKNGQLTFPR